MTRDEQTKKKIKLTGQTFVHTLESLFVMITDLCVFGEM